MDHLVAPAISQNCLNFYAFVSGDGARVGARISGQSAREKPAVAPLNQDRVAALEFAFDRNDAGGEKTRAAGERGRGAVIDRERCRPD